MHNPLTRWGGPREILANQLPTLQGHTQLASTSRDGSLSGNGSSLFYNLSIVHGTSIFNQDSEIQLLLRFVSCGPQLSPWLACPLSH